MSERLIDAPVGLFLYDDCMVLKTEYHTVTDGEITPDCYIVSSGEYFWGGVETIEERNALEVTPVEAKSVVNGRWITHSDGTTECSKCHTLGSPQWKCCPVCTAQRWTERRMRMREILFRGKRLVDGEWIVGYFVVTGRYSAIKPKGEVYYGVDPSTVGQFTGLTDKNDKRIFEGDILRIGGKSLPHWLDEGDIKAVEYNEGAFSPLCDYDSDCGMFVESSECEVIGNIHDNP